MATPYYIGGFAQNNGTTGTITVDTAAAAGDMVVVGASNVSTGYLEIESVADSRGNTYTQQVAVTGGSTSDSFGSATWTSVLATALTLSDTITVTFDSYVSAGQAVACGISGGATADRARRLPGSGRPGRLSPAGRSRTPPRP